MLKQKINFIALGLVLSVSGAFGACPQIAGSYACNNTYTDDTSYVVITQIGTTSTRFTMRVYGKQAIFDTDPEQAVPYNVNNSWTHVGTENLFVIFTKASCSPDSVNLEVKYVARHGGRIEDDANAEGESVTTVSQIITPKSDKGLMMKFETFDHYDVDDYKEDGLNCRKVI